jgi:hypothetical protein
VGGAAAGGCACTQATSKLDNKIAADFALIALLPVVTIVVLGARVMAAGRMSAGFKHLATRIDPF